MDLRVAETTKDAIEPERIADFDRECRGSVADFQSKHGNAFLVHHGTIGALNVPIGPLRTVAVESVSEANGGVMQHDFLVFRVRSTERSNFPNFISVGRTKNNDIVVPDVSLSKFHAFFREEAGVMLLQDAGSRNGTFLDGDPVPSKQKGDPQTIESGALVRFGSVEMTFLRAEAFCELVQRLGKA